MSAEQIIFGLIVAAVLCVAGGLYINLAKVARRGVPRSSAPKPDALDPYADELPPDVEARRLPPAPPSRPGPARRKQKPKRPPPSSRSSSSSVSESTKSADSLVPPSS